MLRAVRAVDFARVLSAAAYGIGLWLCYGRRRTARDAGASCCLLLRWEAPTQTTLQGRHPPPRAPDAQRTSAPLAAHCSSPAAAAARGAGLIAGGAHDLTQDVTGKSVGRNAVTPPSETDKGAVWRWHSCTWPIAAAIPPPTTSFAFSQPLDDTAKANATLS